MLLSEQTASVPVDSNLYSYLTNPLLGNEQSVKNPELVSKIIRKESGEIDSVQYYSSGNVLSKEVFYYNDDLAQVDIYSKGMLNVRKVYDNANLIKHCIYDIFNGSMLANIEYSYDKRGHIISIKKITPTEVVYANYEYDDLERIIERVFFVNEEQVVKQNYKYDILNRIISYTDDTKKILVKEMSKNNNLISYTITDNMGHVISVENCFVGKCYDYSIIRTSSKTTTVKDVNYVGNIDMQKPFAREDDLDFVIANILRNYKAKNAVKKNSAIEKAEQVIETGIQNRVLPISIRKRIMYDITNRQNK